MLAALWLVLLLLPVPTTIARANGWETPSWHLLAVGAWTGAAAWALLPWRWLLALSFPLVMAGVCVVAADLLRSVDVLELIAVSYTFGRGEAQEALLPYAWPAAAATAVALAILALLWRHTDARPRFGTGARAGVVLCGVVLGLALPTQSWRNAWPMALGIAVVEARTNDIGLGPGPGQEDARATPRSRFENWEARREAAAPGRETYVLVISDSVRSDRLAGCGGRPQVTAPPPDALLFCDVLAGASSTHVSVPLLVSRHLPGLRHRVPRDATLLKAFEAAGFETYWLALQERAIAWPDARNMAFAPLGRDRDALLPMLQRALVAPAPRKLIVLHGYTAHFPYAKHYDPAQAPFPVDREKIRSAGGARGALDEVYNDYDNAVDASMRFLREVVARLEAQDGEAFLLYTSDHAENLWDDARGLSMHALKFPTLWDTRVPGVAWANEAWRERQPRKWHALEANRRAGLMHMDFAPTLLGAAGIAYTDRRTGPVDLTAGPVPPRKRYTHLGPGQTITLEMLREQTGAVQAARPPHPASSAAQASD